MKNTITELQSSIAELMRQRISADDYSGMASLAPLVARVETLSKRQAQIDEEMAQVKALISGMRKGRELPSFAQREDIPASGSKSQTLRIIVDWAANDKGDKPSQEIRERTSAATMVKFIEVMLDELGDVTLQKLSRLRINRGPLLSTDPKKDFLNPIQGNLYSHKKLVGTDYYVLTHSSTQQKVKDLKRICDVLGFKKGTVQIDEVDRWTNLF